MPQSMDAVTSFSHLTTNLPEWILEIDKLHAHATEKHREFAAEYSRLLQTARPKRIKSPSITSIHSTGDKAIERGPSSTGEDATSPPLAFPEISPFEAGNRYLYAQARRKRKPTSSVRSGASGPQKFRSKQSVVIYYDSFMQEKLDTMVKNIASARNNIRKGKVSRSLHQGLQLPTFSRQFAQTYNSSSEDPALPHLHSTISLPIDTKRTVIQTQIPANDSCFCQADKALESAQSLCETAAHQFLRDGDCKLELAGAKAKFEGLMALATEALEKFRAERQSEEEQEEARTDSEATLCEKPSQDPIVAKLAPSLFQYTSQPALNLVVPGALEIEVDEDDSSSIDVDISNFRSARAAGGRMGLRSGR
jgi:hypothetical protein